MASNAEMFPFDDVIMYNVKAAVPRIGIPILKKNKAAVRVSLQWEAINWQDSIFILRRSPVLIKVYKYAR